MLEDIFRIPQCTLSGIIPSVCDALWEELSTECIVLPQTPQDWLQKSQEFLDNWQYPFGLAALDGKHVEVQAFGKSGSQGLYSQTFFAESNNYLHNLIK